MCQLIRTLQHDISECTFYLLPDTLPKQMPLVPLHREVIARNMFCHVNRIESNNQILRLSPSVSVSFMLVLRLPSPSTLLPICHWLKKTCKKEETGLSLKYERGICNGLHVARLKGLFQTTTTGCGRQARPVGRKATAVAPEAATAVMQLPEQWTVNSANHQPLPLPSTVILKHCHPQPIISKHYQLLPICSVMQLLAQSQP